MHRSDIFQPHIFIIEDQMRKLSVDGKVLRTLQGSVDGDFSRRFTVTAELLYMQGRQQERIEVDILDRSFSVQGKRIGEAKSKSPGELPGAHC